MPRLPVPGSDDGTWGDILNEFLQTAHNSDGSLKTGGAPFYVKPSGGIAESDFASAVQTKLNSGGTLSGLSDVDTSGAISGSILKFNGSTWVVGTDVSSGTPVWGSIGGTLSDQTDLQNALDAKADSTALTTHTGNTSNPHSVTKAQVGLGNADNTSDLNKPISTATQTALDAKASNTDLTNHAADTTSVHGIADTSVLETTTGAQTKVDAHVNDATAAHAASAIGFTPAGTIGATNVQAAIEEVASEAGSGVSLASTNPANLAGTAAVGTAGTAARADHVHSNAGLATDAELSAHTSDTANPHSVTKAQVGLANADNTADADKPVSTATQTALDAKASSTDLTTHTSATTSVHGIADTSDLVTTSELTDASSQLQANEQTANYTLVLSDAGKVVEMNSASALNLTVPANATVAFPVGTILEIYQHGNGQVTIVEDSGVTVNSKNGLKLAGQFSSAALRKRGTDEWVLVGDLTE